MFLFGPPKIDRLLARGRVKRLIKALTYRRDADIRRQAILALGELGKPGQRPMPKAVEALVDKLQAQEYRRECATALGQIGDVRAVEALLITLQDADPQVRAAAATALGAIRDGRAIRPLMDHFGDADASVREAVLSALQAMGAETDEILQQALTDQDPVLQQGAVQALEARAWQPEQNATSAEYWILKAQWDKVAEIGEPAVEPLLAALDEPATAASVAKTLGAIGDARALEPLTELMHDPRDEVRLAATKALGILDLPEALPTLLGALDDAMPEVRAAAAKALGGYAPKEATAPLLGVFDDPAHEVRSAVAEALVQLGDPSSAPALVNALGDEHPRVRTLAEEGLNGMASEAWPNIIPLLIARLGSRDRALRDRAAKLLDRYDWQPTPDADGAAYYIVRRRWEDVRVLGAIAVIPLVLALHDTFVRKRAVEQLGELGQPAVAPLVAALSDEDPEVQQAAALALGAIGDPASLGPLLALVLAGEAELGEPQQEVELSQVELRRNERIARQRLAAREAAADALGGLGAAAVPSLVSQLKASDPQDEELRKLLTRALAQAGAPAVEPLITILGDAALAPIAAQALIDVGEPSVAPLVSALRNPELQNAAVQVLANLELPATQRLAALAAETDESVVLGGLEEVAINILDAERFALLATALQRCSPPEATPGDTKLIARLLSHEAAERESARAALAGGLPDQDLALARAHQASLLLAQAEETLDSTEALYLSRKALLSAPTFSSAWVSVASIIRRRLEAPEVAIGWIMQAMALLDEDAAIGSEDERGVGDNPHAWVELGLIHKALRDPISATSVFAAATLISPEMDDVTPWLHLIEVYRQTGRVQELYAAMQRAQALGAQIPEDLDADWATLVACVDRQALARMLSEVAEMENEPSSAEEEPA